MKKEGLVGLAALTALGVVGILKLRRSVPTVKKVRGFISKDTTHTEALYNCAYYTQEFLSKVSDKGWSCFPVILYFDLTPAANLYSSHVIVVFATTEGLLFYDPQQGREVAVNEGVVYSFPSGEWPIQKFIILGKFK